MGSACNLGGYLSLPAGLFYDWLASRGLNHLAPRHAKMTVSPQSSVSVSAHVGWFYSGSFTGTRAAQ